MSLTYRVTFHFGGSSKLLIWLTCCKFSTPCPNWHWKLKKVQRVLTIKSSFSCIRLSYFHWIECFWWVLFEIMQNLHLLRLPKSAYFYLVSKSDIDRPSKRTHQNSSILWKLLSPMHEKELWVVKTLWTFFSCQCQFRSESGSAGMPRPISYAVFCLKK